MFAKLLRHVVGKVIARPLRRQLAAFDAATCRPREVQQDLLFRILRRHAETDFGRAHHFASMHTVADFRSRVPVAGYEYIEPYMDRVRRGALHALLADNQVHMLALTSGTTAARKYIPVTPQYLADYRRGWHLWGLRAFRDHPEVKLRPIVQLSGDWQEFRTEAGIPCGAVTGLTAIMQKRIIRFLYCVPACTGRIKDPIAKYYLALRLSLPRRVGLLLAANPSTLINLARTGDEYKETLIRDLYDGTLDPCFDIPGSIRSELARQIRRRHPRRARELEAIIGRTGTLYPKDYWPDPFLLGNWTGGSVGAYLRHYPRYFGAAPVRDVGLIASEGRMTIPIADNTASGVLDITSHYFEFLPEAEAGKRDPIVLAAHEVEEGRNYFILPTTAYGLYRYHICDLVRVTGFHNATPLVEFLSKGSHFANLTGEKLSEYQVTNAVREALRELDLPLTAFTLAPCWNDGQPYYGLFAERTEIGSVESGCRLAETVDRLLQKLNEEYAAKRSSLRLGPIHVQVLPAGTWARWDEQRLARCGGSLEQYKRPCLIPDLTFRDSMPVEEEIAPGPRVGLAAPAAHSNRAPLVTIKTDPQSSPGTN